MKFTKTILLGVSALVFSCNIQNNPALNLDIIEFNFESIFGHTNQTPNNTYSLLGMGYFRAPSSNNSDSLIDNWIKNNPKAKVVPVSSFGPVSANKPDSKMIFCLVIQNNDTLNNYLIKNGCFPAGTMQAPPDIDKLIEENEYNNFINQIKAAELYARKNKLGIHSEK